MHPADQVELFRSLEIAQQKQMFLFLSPQEFADIFAGLDSDDQAFAFAELSFQYAVSMLNHMPADDVADFFAKIELSNADEILGSMDQEEANRVKELMAYEPKTAGSIMTKEFIRLSVSATAKNVIEQLREIAPDAETIYYLYVVDSEQKLAGVVSLRDLIIASPEMTINDIMSSQIVSVSEETDQEDVARMIKEYDFF